MKLVPSIVFFVPGRQFLQDANVHGQNLLPPDARVGNNSVSTPRIGRLWPGDDQHTSAHYGCHDADRSPTTDRDRGANRNAVLRKWHCLPARHR